jgi:acid phosphatase family membrane protein YuiD
MILSLISDLVSNDILWVSIVASTLAQFLKPFTYWWRTREFNWHHLAETGGMPSSHTALVSCLAVGLGLEQGFGSPFFAIAVVLSMIVTYDAQGVRRQAGAHAHAINEIIAELLSGHELEQRHFEEVLGHSWWEVMGGIVFGVLVMVIWKFVIQPPFLQ